MKQNTHQYLVVPPQNNQNWRSKSLNAGNLQRHLIPITKTYPQSKQKMSVPPQSLSTQKIVPRITKINQNLFCVLLNNFITIFSYVDQQQRERNKIRSKFVKETIVGISMPNDIEWVCGDGTTNIYIGSQNQLLVLNASVNYEKQSTIQVKEVWRKRIGNIKCFSIINSNLKKTLIILTYQSVLLYDINKNYSQVKQLPISFSSQSSGWKNINQINGICIIVQSLNTFYFIGTSIQLKTDVRSKLGRDKDGKNQGVSKKCQALYLTKFQITKKDVQARVFIIDHIFQIGIFKKSRGYQVGNETFLLSLHEQIIVIRRNFSKFMVWDNVSIISSKSNQKKGQLILAGKKIMLYTQNGQISAHQLFFNFDKAKIQTPKIDNLRGNSFQQQVLYDGIVLQFKKDSYMKVLFYFKQNEIYIPNRPIRANIQGSENIKTELSIQIMCIQQTQPTQKLKQLLNKNKSIEQISQFLRRFNINDIRYRKSAWQVSIKGQKQIQQLLLNINDNDYIQSQLTKILKQKPHDLQFLITIQKKQIQRYRTMLANKLLKYQQQQNTFTVNKTSGLKKKKSKQDIIMAFVTISQIFKMRQLDQIKLCIQWLLQSKMFQRKLLYSLNFMSFKQYDFIQIGKLRAVSLREEIKLLGVKGYQKRLKYFFNSFKYLVLDDFRQILRFVIGDLSQQQMRLFFIKNFPFILPSYVHNQQQDPCKLWQDTFKQDEARIQTINSFKKEIIQQIKKIQLSSQFFIIPPQKSIQIFNQLFEQFRRQQWFKVNSYKQHSLLRHSLEELKQEFRQLKQVGVYNIITQIMYQKIYNKKYNQNKVQQIIKQLKQQKYLPEDYVLNIYARLQVYEFIAKLMQQNKKQYIDINLIPKSNFIILKENIYFQFLVKNFMRYLTKNIRDIYQNKRKGFFTYMFNLFLYSPQAKLHTLIDFIDCFRNIEQDELRVLVFKRICEMMSITDAQSSQKLVDRLKQMPIALQQSTSSKKKHKVTLQKLPDQAKIALGVYFTNLYKYFQLDYTYNQLLLQTKQTSIKKTKILNQLLHKYAQNFNKNLSQVIKFPQYQLIDRPLPDLQLSEPIDFISVMLYIHDMMAYQFPAVSIFNVFMCQLFQRNKFQQVRAIMDDIIQFGKLFEDRQLIDNYPHYQLINNYKHQNNIKKLFQDIVLQWIHIKYYQLAQLTKHLPYDKQNKQNPNIIQNQQQQQQQTIQKIKQTFFSISSILKILNIYNYNEKVQKQINRISFLQNIRKLSDDLLCSMLCSLIVEEDKYYAISGFVFMVNLINNINKTTLNINNRQKILQILSYLSHIHKQYQIVYHSQSKKNQQVMLGQYCRFNAQFTVYLVQCQYAWFAAFVLLDLFNSSFYYRDVLFYFLARVIDTKKMDMKTIQRIIYQFMTIENVPDLKKILNNMIVKYQLAQVVSPECVVTNIKIIFAEILKNNQLDQAFFFAIRNKQVSAQQFQHIAHAVNKFRDDHIIAQTLILAFIRATKQKIQGQNNPTFMIFKTKLNCLMRPMQRMQVIKDVVILMSKIQIQQLKQKVKILQQQQSKVQNKVQQRKLLAIQGSKQDYIQQLRDCYKKYMQAQNLNPWLTINAQQVQPTAIRIQKYPQYTVDQRQSKQSYYKILPIIRAQQSQQVKQLRRKLFDNEKRLKQIQQGNRQLMQQQITAAITEVKLNAQKQQLSLLERKKKRKQQDQEISLKQKQKQKAKQQGYDDQQYENQIKKINQQQKDKIQQSQKTYSSKIVKQTQNLISQLRQRRKKIKQQTAATAGTIGEQNNPNKPQQQSKSNKSKVYRNDKSSYLQDSIKDDSNMKHSLVYGVGKSSHVDDLRNSNKLFPSNRYRNQVDDSKKSTIFKDNLKFDMMKQSHLRTTTINKLIGDKNGQYYVPRWDPKVPKRLQQQQIKQQKEKKSGALLQSIKRQISQQSEKLQKGKRSIHIQKDKDKLKQKQKQKQKKQKQKQKQKKLSLPQLINKYSLLNEGHASQMIQKISILHNNPSAGTDIIKNIYSQMKQIRNFISLCQDLLTYNQNFSQFIQHKALKIVQDSMRMKLQLPYKQIYTANFYTSVHHVAMRDYYHIAYGIIKPHIIKIIQQIGTKSSDTKPVSINSLATMIRFGFGSDPTFSYKVYQDYIRSLLQDYQSKSQLVFVEKDILVLAQKLRNIYGNLNPTNKNIKFQQLIQQINNKQKRKTLIKALLNNLQSKSSLVSKQGYEEFRLVLTKMESHILG